MPDWMKYNEVKKTAVASEKPGREARRREWGEDEHSPQWRGEACRSCRFWTGCVCLDDWEDYRGCPLVSGQRRTENGKRKTERPCGATEKPSLQASKLPSPGPSGHGVHLFDW